MSGTDILPAFPSAINPTAVHAATTAFPAGYFIEHLLELSSYLIDLTNGSTLFGRLSSNPDKPSLYTLLARLQNKQLAPSRLPSEFQAAEHIQSQIHLRADKEAAYRPLADFEDIYYATLARIKEIHQLLHIRIHSGFNKASDAICEGGPTISELHASLTEYWIIFNDPACGKALDDAVRAARVKALRDEVVWQVENNNMSADDAHEHLEQLYSPDVYAGVLGMIFVPDWAPAIVGIYLEQKYRPMLDAEKQDAGAKAKTQRRKERIEARKAAARAQAGEAAVEQCQAMSVQTPVGDVETFLADKFNAQCRIQDDVQPALQHSPEHQVQVHHGKHHEAQSAAVFSQQDLEYGHASESTIDMMLEWHMKAQRVSEYSNYLRANASQDVQQVLRGARDM